MKPKSKFKGVSWNTYRQKWRSGYFDTETEAVKARDLRIILLS